MVYPQFYVPVALENPKHNHDDILKHMPLGKVFSKNRNLTELRPLAFSEQTKIPKSCWPLLCRDFRYSYGYILTHRTIQSQPDDFLTAKQLIHLNYNVIYCASGFNNV